MVFLKANDARNSANIIMKLLLQKVSAQKKSRTCVQSWTRDFAESHFSLQRKEILKSRTLTIRLARHGCLKENYKSWLSNWSLLSTSERNQRNSFFLCDSCSVFISGWFTYIIEMCSICQYEAVFVILQLVSVGFVMDNIFKDI